MGSVSDAVTQWCHLVTIGSKSVWVAPLVTLSFTK